MRRMSYCCGAAAAAISLGLATTPTLARDVHLKGVFSFLAVGPTYTIEAGHSYFVGQFTGSYLDETGTGPFHQTMLVCPGFNDIGKVAGGYCVLRDLSGDQVFIEWTCTAAAPPAGAILGGACEAAWTGGTGKFEGISGGGPYTAVIVNVTPDGSAVAYALWDHMVTIPD